MCYISQALALTGWWATPPIAMAKNAIGLAIATEEYGSKFFANGAQPSGVLEHPGTIKDPQRVRDSWMSQFGGSANSNKIAVLEEGLDLEKSSFSNIEQQSLEFVKYTLEPWLVRWEQSIQRILFSADEKKRYFVRFNVEGLLRGDYASWMSANDIRELENLDRIPAEEGGDLYLINGNMTKLKDAGIFAASGAGKEVLPLKKIAKIAETASSKVKLKKIRVAAYCRVSTDSDAQLESLEAQKTHYENYIP